MYLSLFTLLAAFGVRVYAQEVNASVYGIVQDNSGSVIPGVEVQVRSLDLGAGTPHAEDRL
jgi:hypothetical protein